MPTPSTTAVLLALPSEASVLTYRTVSEPTPPGQGVAARRDAECRPAAAGGATAHPMSLRPASRRQAAVASGPSCVATRLRRPQQPG
jgi:hypothetical protein